MIMKGHFMVMIAVAYQSASATLLDDFRPLDHSQDISFGGAFEGGHSLVGTFTGGMVGGERDVELSQFENTSFPGPTFMTRYEENRGPYFRIGGYGNETPGNGTDGHVIVQYDGVGDEQGNTGR